MPTLFLLLIEAALGAALIFSFRDAGEPDARSAAAAKWSLRLLLLVAMGVTLSDLLSRLSAAPG